MYRKLHSLGVREVYGTVVAVAYGSGDGFKTMVSEF